MRWGELRDRVKAGYEDGSLKTEVANNTGLDTNEIDRILGEYEPEPLNFGAQMGSLWTGFQMDELDPPYGPMLEGKYHPHPLQLGDMDVDGFLTAMGKVFGYWGHGRLVLLMGCLRRGGQFVPLPHLCANLMTGAGWRIIDWLANGVHRPSSEHAVALAQHQELRLPMRPHIDIIVGQRP